LPYYKLLGEKNFGIFINFESNVKTMSMKNLKRCGVILFVMVFGFSLMSSAQQSKPWEVPAKFKTMQNPVKSDDASIQAGKTLYNKTCAACHGKTGLGDGPKSKSLSIAVASFAKAEYQNQSDGDQFYKTKTGRGEMPKYEGKIEDEGIWQIVNYLRTFKK
jgi:mono/diheme cytochrome c family protein